MSDLVAVVAGPGAGAVSPDEVESLAAHHQDLRGVLPRALLGCDRARVIVLGPEPLGEGPTTQAPSWVAWAGTMYPRGEWTARHVQELEGAEGHFSLVSYDAEADTVLVANDPMGMQPLYIAERADRTYVSTSALVLARHLGCPASTLGVQSFLLSGYQFGTRTNWDDIIRLNPATCLTFTADGMERRTYWRPEADRSIAALSLNDAATRAIEVLVAACRAFQASDEHCVDLTGGFDSRLLALALDATGVAFCTNTRATTSRDDVDIARKIAARRGWEWHHLRLEPEWPLLLSGVLPTALAWGDAQLEVLQLARVLHLHQRLAAHRTHLLTSAGGEHFERNWESEFFNAGRSRDFRIDRWIDMTALKRGDGAVLSGEAEEDVRSDFRRRLMEWVEPYVDELNTTKLEILHAYKSTGHGGAYRAADGAFLRTELPYYFKPVFSTAMSVNYRYRNGHALHRQMIDRLDHEVAKVRTTHGGSALPRRLWRPDREVPYQAVVARKVVGKLTAQALGRALLVPAPQFPWQQAANGAVLSELRKDGVLDWRTMRIAPLLRRDRFEALVEHSLRAGFCHNAVLGRVITAEMALRATDTALD